MVAALLVSPAHADLYRWVDRETGSVKFSNTPPPWYGDPAKERTAPAVEVIRYRGPGAPAKPPPDKPAAAELERLDPEDAARRRAQDARLFSR